MITRCATLVLVLSAVPLAGCAANTGGSDAVGYVLLDREAQVAGNLSYQDWERAPILPVALELDEPTFFVSSAGKVKIDLRPGMVAWVHGAGGAVEWRALRDEVRDDRLRVHATREAADALAQRLAGQVVGPAEAGVWIVSAPDIFDRGSFLAVPEGVREAVPVPMLDLGSGEPTSRRAAVLSDSTAALPGPQQMARLVGVYNLGERALFLDAEGGFSLGEGCFLTPVDSGRWHTEGDQVVLEGEKGKWMLEHDPVQGDLRTTAGERYSSALVDSIAAGMPEVEQ
jgi:hypothetical protein